MNFSMNLNLVKKPIRASGKGLPSMCPKAYRWVEMEEISKTHEELDLPKNLFEGAADIYRLVEKSPLGKEIVEDRKLGTSAEMSQMF